MNFSLHTLPMYLSSNGENIVFDGQIYFISTTVNDQGIFMLYTGMWIL